MTFAFFVQSTTGTKYTIASLGAESTILDIKQTMEQHDGLPEAMITLVYAGKKLEDGKTLAECGITAGATVNYVLALRAGA